MTAVVFDIGNVLVRWDPHLVWLDELGSREAVDDFLARIDFSTRNLRGDKGERFSDMADELEDPADADRLRAYVSRFGETVQEKITGSWNLLYRLKDQGHPVHAITNWSAETWPVGVETHPELGEVFGTLIVSGQEKILKPEKAIFDLLCARAGHAPEDCLFIDDSPKNVEGAKQAGWDAVLFTAPEKLEADLSQRGLL